MSETQNFEFGRAGPAEFGPQETLAELNTEIIQSHIATVPSLQEQWSALNGSARLRLAGCPFLLVDAGFAQPQRWASIPNFAVHESTPVRALLASRSALSIPLVRRVLLLAWHMARTNRAGARIALGMNRRCATIMAHCRLADLEAVAERRPVWIRPRWDQHHEVWRTWLSAAAKESPRRLEALQLWGLQMLAAEVRRAVD
jgi:hypothetical protein